MRIKKGESKGRRFINEQTHLFESSAIPASALYHAVKAARIAKNPPAFSMGRLGWSVASRCRYEIPRRRKAMSRVKNRVKNATVERRVQRRRMKVKMNQPCQVRELGFDLGGEFWRREVGERGKKGERGESVR